MNKPFSILLIESSEIIRTGLIGILKQIDNIEVKSSSYPDIDAFKSLLKRSTPDVLIINPNLQGLPSVGQIRKEVPSASIKLVALQVALADDNALRQFDELINLYDTSSSIHEKIIALLDNEGDEHSTEQLSNRELEVLIWLIKGLTNKEIASKLFLSTHTIITHRKNIASKLKIHSTAGLTIYAIVNKLISLEEIKKAQDDQLNQRI